MPTQRFDDLRAPTPDLDELKGSIDALLAELARATTVDAVCDLIKRWDQLREGVDTWGALVDLRFNQDTADEQRRADREQKDELSPRWTELTVMLQRALLDHPLRAEVEARIGAQAFALWEVDVLSFDPAIKDDLVAESKLEAEYTGLLAAAELSFRGESLNFSTIVRYRQDKDRETRHDSAAVTWDWYGEHGDELDRIYDDMVRLRTKTARQLGFADFVELGYKRMMRIDYDRKDVDRFRAQVREHVVPLANELAGQQRTALGVDELMAWDEPVMDPNGNPAPKGDHDWMVERATEMFDEMGSGLGEFFGLMRGGGFLDLKSRQGKAGGGFCTSFPTIGMPFVFANFNGTKGDVEVFTHEIGHAFQNYRSRDNRPLDYVWPTLESCEVHSMSLEFLTWPHMEKFFGDGADRFRRMHLTESLMFLPYGTAVDHFQHEVYENPDATPAERHAMWLRMEETYLPWRKWGDLAYPGKGGRWQSQRHIYLNPFYYIDYVLAQTCALQFLARSRKDETEAMSAYVALCARGGEAPFQQLTQGAGLKSPFDDGCLEAVVREARTVLDG